jgi:hypothetical protein
MSITIFHVERIINVFNLLEKKLNQNLSNIILVIYEMGVLIIW